MGIKSLVKQALIERENRKYEKHLQERRMTYREWCRLRELEAPGGKNVDADISAYQNTGDFILFCAGNGVLSENAKDLIGAYFARHPQVQILYGDEDVWEAYPEGERRMPWFKPDWSPDLFDSYFYFGSLVAVRREFLKGMQDIARQNVFEKSEVSLQEELIRTLVEKAGAYEPGSGRIGHISEVLFHCESEEAIGRYYRDGGHTFWEAKGILSVKPDAGVSEKREHPVLSIIIPSKDHPEILSVCLNALSKAAGALSFEVIVVDNGSSEENRAAVNSLLQNWSKRGRAQTCCIYRPMEFNFSKMCNLGAKKARGEFLLFLNDDVDLCMEGSLERMLALAARPYTGAVGIKLYYPDSVKIQHAGIVNLPMGPVHKLQFLEDHVSWYFGSNRGNKNVLAVTAACLMVEKKKFLRAGGFSEELRVAFNDVDFCFTLWELGFFNVCMNEIHACHHESLSRGDDESEEKLNRLLEEKEKLYKRHPSVAGGYDPYYSIHLNRRGLDTRICPGYETAGNTLQVWDGIFREKDFSDYRQDNCFLVRVESVQKDEVSGYCVVLGDDNSCYEMELLLQKADAQTASVNTFSASHIFRAVPIEGQYRPDLTENMPDQKNVGLCGFWVRLSNGNNSSKKHTAQNRPGEMLPQGVYRIGAAARNRVTGIRLLNWTNYKIKI